MRKYVSNAKHLREKNVWEEGKNKGRELEAEVNSIRLRSRRKTSVAKYGMK